MLSTAGHQREECKGEDCKNLANSIDKIFALCPTHKVYSRVIYNRTDMSVCWYNVKL